MVAIENSYILRTLMFLSIVFNIAIYIYRKEDLILHAAMIFSAIPLLIGSHLIIINFDITKSDGHQVSRNKEFQAEKWFSRLMFGYFGAIISFLLVFSVIMRQ